MLQLSCIRRQNSTSQATKNYGARLHYAAWVATLSRKPSTRRNTHIVVAGSLLLYHSFSLSLFSFSFCIFLFRFPSLRFGPEIMLVIYIRGLTPLVSGIFVTRCSSIARAESEMSFKKVIYRQFHQKYKVNNLDVISRKIGYHFINPKVYYTALRCLRPRRPWIARHFDTIG